MPLNIRQVGPCFAGEVDGIDLTQAAAGRRTSPQFMPAWTSTPSWSSTTRTSRTSSSWPSRRASARSSIAIGTSLRRPEDHRLPTTFADVSNLDKDNKPFARDDRRRLFAIGNRLWHSDSSFKVDPGQVLAAACALDPVEGRQHRVRLHAGRLRCARPGDEGPDRGPRLRALADVLARQARLHRFHARGARALQAGAPAAGARASEHGAQVALSLLARRHHRRLAGAGGEGAS